MYIFSEYVYRVMGLPFIDMYIHSKVIYHVLCMNEYNNIHICSCWWL